MRKRGPADIRTLTRTFNDMQARIAALISEKDQMLGAIGHDLRTPLASLRIRAESVEDEDERQGMIAAIEAMHGDLEDILTLARLGQAKSPPVETDIGSMIERIAAEWRQGGASVVTDVPADCVARVHATALSRAIRNLVANAVKYGGNARICRRHSRTRNSGSMSRTTDPGIAAGDLSRATDAFVRLEGSRNRTTGGSGLGLAIVKSVAALHGGSLKLSNRESGGLRASLTLPIYGPMSEATESGAAT